MVAVDNVHVHEDLAGKSGPLIGPGLFRQFITPYYRKIYDFLAERGTELFSLDSDGNILSVLDEMLDGGVVFGLDHRITNGTPIENYRHYIDEAHRLLGRG